jgi:hypothetical protein
MRTAKKTTAKRAAAKRAAARKVVAKKLAAKTTTVKKGAAKGAVTRRPAAEKKAAPEPTGLIDTPASALSPPLVRERVDGLVRGGRPPSYDPARLPRALKLFMKIYSEL